MRAVLLFNPRSGSGRAARLAAAFSTALRAAGHTVDPHPTHDDAGQPRPPLTPADLAGAAVLVVAGGDGTVHRAGPTAAQAGCPFYHAPAGTENLFARHYGMTADPALLLRALASGRTVKMDVGIAGDPRAGVRVPFLLMASVGPDAGVIHRLHRSRTGSIRPWSYLRPVLAELADPRIPLLTIRVDGEPWLTRQRGLLVLGNSPHYAWGLNPARGALADDGRLDAAFYPADTAADLAAWAAKLLVRRDGPLPGVACRRGRSFEVGAPGGALLQMDGEAGPSWESLGHHGWVVFGTLPDRLRVLAPQRAP